MNFNFFKRKPGSGIELKAPKMPKAPKPSRAPKAPRVKQGESRLQVIATGEDAAQIKSGRALLAGAAVFASLSQQRPPSQHLIEQPGRDAVGGLAVYLGRNVPKLKIWVDERIFASPKVRFGLAIDGYLSWGLSAAKRGTVLLFGGAGTASDTHVVVLVFKDRRLVDVQEKVLLAEQDLGFVEQLETLIQDFRRQYPAAQFVQAAPLNNWNYPDMRYVGEAPLKGLSYRPLFRNGNHRSLYLVPGVAGAAGIAVYIGMLGMGWDDYASSVKAYDTLLADPALKDGIDPNYLNMVNARRIYMDEPRRQVVLAKKVEMIVRGIGAIPRAQVIELKLPAPIIGTQGSDNANMVSPTTESDSKKLPAGRRPDVWVSIALPIERGPGIFQSEQVLGDLANNTHMSVRIAQDGTGIREEKGRRIFGIEGFIHD